MSINHKFPIKRYEDKLKHAMLERSHHKPEMTRPVRNIIQLNCYIHEYMNPSVDILVGIHMNVYFC